jgi:hypothetical protein
VRRCGGIHAGDYRQLNGNNTTTLTVPGGKRVIGGGFTSTQHPSRAGTFRPGGNGWKFNLRLNRPRP